MVSVVQLVEHQVVILGVAGSSPVTHPTGQITTRNIRCWRFLPSTAPREYSSPRDLRPRVECLPPC